MLQPWTEDPKAQTRRASARHEISGGKKGFVARLMNMNVLADRVQQLASVDIRQWMSAAVRKELKFLGEDNIANKSAVDNLIAMGKAAAPRAAVPEIRRQDRARSVCCPA